MRAILAAVALLATVGAASAECYNMRGVDNYDARQGYVTAIRARPGWDAEVLWELTPARRGAIVSTTWCGRSRYVDGQLWAWVTFQTVEEPWDHKGWVAVTRLPGE